jgi:hypothetical protein
VNRTYCLGGSLHGNTWFSRNNAPAAQNVRWPKGTFTKTSNWYTYCQFQFNRWRTALLLQGGQQELFDNRVGWAWTYLKKAGLIISTQRGFFRITDRRKQILAQNPSKIDRKLLLQFEEFRQFLNPKQEKTSEKEGSETAQEITPEEIYTHPRRNIITRYVGMQQNIEVDLFTEELKSGVSVIFCSDGLWEMVRDNIIRDVMLNTDNVQTACRQLVEIANRNGGADNISVIAIKVTV